MPDISPDKPFFLLVVDGRLDGLLDLETELPLPFLTMDEAVVEANEIANDPAGRIGSYILEVRAVRYIPKVVPKEGEEEPE